MSRLRLAALALGVSLLLGCVSEEAALPQDKELTLEPWVGHWDRALELHKEPGLRALRRGPHLALSTLRVSPARPEELAPGPAALIVVEGGGLYETSAGEHFKLEPGTCGLVSGGRLIAGSELRALVLTPEGKARGALAQPTILGVDQLFPDEVTAPPGKIVEVARAPGLSLHVGAIHKLAGLRRHAHLRHDVMLFFLSGLGTMGVGSEGGDTTSGSRGDELLKRGFTSSPISERALAFLPAEAPHSFVNQGETTLLLAVFGPDFDGSDGHTIPDASRKETPRSARTE